MRDFGRQGFLIIFTLAAGTFLTANPVLAQTWTPVNLPSNIWISGASSADGVKLVAVGKNFIYTSTDAGSHWQMSYSNNLPWDAVASSWDGTKLVAAGSQGNTMGGPIQGQIFTSVDSGSNWTASLSPTNYWKALACSADGTRVVAAIGGNKVVPGPIYTSSDSGTNWSLTTAPPVRWYSVASSADGRTLVAAGINVVSVSRDFGSNWASGAGLPDQPWTYVCCSLDGVRMAVGAQPGIIYTSADSGSNWTMSGSPNLSWNALACSANGTKLAAGCWVSNALYTSEDAGANWQLSPGAAVANWTALVASADGSRWLGVDFSNGVFTLQTRPSPALNIAPAGGNVVLSWLLPSETFGLEGNHGLNNTNWTAIAGAPVLNLTNLQYSLSVSAADSNRFFRLAH